MRRGSLQVEDREVDLRPKSFAVLRHLVENAGRLVSKEEVFKSVWNQRVVSDELLMRCISEVRAAVGDHDQTIIKTVPRRGYLFAGLLTQQPTSESNQTAHSPMTEGKPTIAVLAFANMSGEPEQEYFSDGISEDIITELSRFSELVVIARNSTFQYKGKHTDVRQIGRELGVGYVLEGSVRRESGRVRVSAQLIDATTGGHRWSERYDRELGDVFALQDELARTIVALLAAHVAKAEMERTLSKPPTGWLSLRLLSAGSSYLEHLFLDLQSG